MTPTSRPLRALGVVLGGWTAARVVALWPANVAAELPIIDAAIAAPPIPAVAIPLDDDVPLFASKPLSPRGMKALARVQQTKAARAQQLAAVLTRSPVASEPAPAPSRIDRPEPAPTAIAPGLPLKPTISHWSGSAWALMRGDSASSLASGGQLGGSQIGARLFYTPGPEALAVTARISAPLGLPVGREAAIGIALRGHNVGLIAEQRFALDKGGRDAPAIFGYAGLSDVKLARGLTLDGYAQAGVVGVKNPAAFIDGAIRIETPVLTSGKSSLSIGAGAWGGAQPGTSRVDIGPQIVARVPIGEQTMRISAEWRERIAGNAAPASGPAMTVGFDF